MHTLPIPDPVNIFYHLNINNNIVDILSPCTPSRCHIHNLQTVLLCTAISIFTVMNIIKPMKLIFANMITVIFYCQIDKESYTKSFEVSMNIRPRSLNEKR